MMDTPQKAASADPSAGLPVDINGYWAARRHHDLYRLMVVLARGLFPDARSLIDVGCYTSGLICEMDWIERRVASDINERLTQNWAEVPGVTFVPGDAFGIAFGEPFDLVISNQTVEHLDRPEEFISKLLSLGRGLIVSTTYEVPAGRIDGHVQDPIDLDKFLGWFPCEVDSWTITRHPTAKDIRQIIGIVSRSHPARRAAAAR